MLAGAIDVERQHRHRGCVRAGLAPAAAFCGALQRARDAARVVAGEHAAIQRQRIARLRDVLRPAFACPGGHFPGNGPALPIVPPRQETLKHGR